jgi:hypothetical protein
MKAHDLFNLATAACLLLAAGCDTQANASAKSDSKEAPAAAEKEKEAPKEPEKPAGEPHHCDLIKATGTCFEWTLAADAVQPKEELCTSSKGTFSAGACPGDGDLGTCTLTGDKDIHYYDTHGHYQASPAMTECTALKRGSWKAREG